MIGRFAEWGSRIKFFFLELYFRTWCGNSGLHPAVFYLHPSEIPDAFILLHCALCDIRNYSTVSPVLVVAVMVFILWTLTNIGLYYDCSPRAPALEVARLLASAAGVLALGQ